jgi:hypothetical protein
MGIAIYLSTTSVFPGQKISLYLSTDGPTIRSKIKIKRVDAARPVFETVVEVKKQKNNDNLYAVGCGWSKNCDITVGEQWEHGVYLIQCLDEQENPLHDYVWDTGVGSNTPGSSTAVFVVRNKIPGERLYMLGTTTWNAYNSWGGKSLYDYNSTDKQPHYSVSYQRPCVATHDWLTLRYDEDFIK